MNRQHTFGKAERLCSRKTIEALFAGGNKSLSAYPIRAIYMPVGQAGSAPDEKAETEENGGGRKDKQPKAQLLISVSKRHFKHAVDRNRVKRQIREAYRLNKHLLLDTLPTGRSLAIAFIWLTSEHFPTRQVEEKVRKTLIRIAENTARTDFTHAISGDCQTNG